MNEEKLIQEIKKNPNLFDQVYNSHYQTIFNYCYRRTNNFNAAKDISSETFLKAYLKINSFKWKGISILNWLYRIATNETNIFFRSKKYQPLNLSEIYTYYPQSQFSDQEEKENAEIEFEKNQQFIEVQKVVSELPLKYQEVISLKYYQSLKIKEISVVLNKKEGTIKSLLSRGISKLKDRI